MKGKENNMASDEYLQEKIDELRRKEANIIKEINKTGVDDKGRLPVVDGIINITNYLTAPYKILWILKETGIPAGDEKEKGGWDLVHSKEDGISEKDGIWATYCMDDMYEQKELVARRVMIVSYAVFASMKEKEFVMPNLSSTEDKKMKALKSIAIINIKKTPGSNLKADENEISRAYNNNKILLHKQIKTYDPQIIIFGNTFRHFKGIVDINSSESKIVGFNKNFYFPFPLKNDHKYYLYKNRIYISVIHPAFHNNDRCYKTKEIQEDERDYIENIVNVVFDWENKL
jgi:hypothetical protein